WSFFFSSSRRHTRFSRDWSSDVCSSDLDYREAAVVSVDGPARYVVQYADGSRETVRRGRVSAGHLVVTVRYTGSVWDAEAPGGYRRVHPGIGRLTDETAPAAVESGTVTAARGTYRLRS